MYPLHSKKNIPVILAAFVLLSSCSSRPNNLQSPYTIEDFSITSERIAFDGRSFGDTGTYSYLHGVATVRVNPAHPSNRNIVDLLAVADSEGWVRYRTDLAILRPTSAEHASKTLVVEIANRGNKLALPRLADGANQFDTAEQGGNGWVLQQGHTLAWIGWQGDVPLGKKGDVIGTDFPVITGVTGKVSEEFIFDNDEVKSTALLTYPIATQAASNGSLWVKASNNQAPEKLPSTSWRVVNDREIEIERPSSFDGGAIYTFTYTATNPRPMGLGFAAIRDLTSFLKGEQSSDQVTNPLQDLRPETTILFGISQSGRFLRDFMWEGFNESASGSAVFDGAMPIIAGSRKSYVNMRFSQPGRYSRQHEDHLYPGDQFPFTYATSTDPISGRTDGIFKRCSKSDTCPKLMHLDSSLEFWQARASLLGVDGAGRQIKTPDNVRFYLMGSTQHAPSASPTAGICQQPNNTAIQAPLVRALFQQLVGWAANDIQPEPSRYPLAPSDLAHVDRAEIGFPDLSTLGINFPGTLNELRIKDGNITSAQASREKSYMVMVPRTNADGHDLAAVRLPDVAVPLATHTGWNLRKEGFAKDQLCTINGMEVPLFSTREERLAAGDPRPSVEERYPSRSAYVEQVRTAAESLVAERFLLPGDAQAILKAAAIDPRIQTLKP